MIMNSNFDINQRPDFDVVVQQITDFVLASPPPSAEAYRTARYCLMDSIGCGLLALQFPECRKLLGPVVEGTTVPNGSRVLGTDFVLDPVKAAWDIGCIIRWLDFNDTWLAAEWGHPSDNLGAILSVCDHLSQVNSRQGIPSLTVKDVLIAMVQAHEIQGILALENSFNRVGLDHVLLVRVASTAVTTRLMGGNQEQIMAAISHAWADGGALRTYRHAPNAGSRKSWAAGDATSRAVALSQIAMKGEMGIPGVLTARQWGFYDVLFSLWNQNLAAKPLDGRQFRFQREFGCYVMENILFKLSFPAEFHAQTACEAAVLLYPQLQGRLHEIQRIIITTHDSAIRIISKQGELSNPADRDHCLQYMVAVALITGNLTAECYEDDYHRKMPQIDVLRNKMEIEESQSYSKDYYDPEKRSIANSVQILFNDGTSTDHVEIEYPIGHRRRREEGIPVLVEKFRKNASTCFSSTECDALERILLDEDTLEKMPVHLLMNTLVKSPS
jgi:2-methylcitrate dehydratase